MRLRGIVIYTLALFFLVIIILRLLGFTYAIVISDSMEPTVSRWSIVVVRSLHNNETIQPGDIILYHININGNEFRILHRVYDISVRNGVTYYLTKGDNRNYFDGWYVPYDNVDGKLWIAIPYVGYIIMLLGRLFIILYPILIGIMWFFVVKDILDDIRRVRFMRINSAKKRKLLYSIRRRKMAYNRIYFNK